MMEKEFQMSMMRELTFSLGIQVKEMKQVTFIHQAKYTKDLMKKLNMAELKPVSTLLSTATSLDPDKNGEATEGVWEHACLPPVPHGDMVRHSVHCVPVFSESSDISNTLSSLGFGILLLPCWIMLLF
jgi:hypothetical protein